MYDKSVVFKQHLILKSHLGTKSIHFSSHMISSLSLGMYFISIDRQRSFIKKILEDSCPLIGAMFIVTIMLQLL